MRAQRFAQVTEPRPTYARATATGCAASSVRPSFPASHKSRNVWRFSQRCVRASRGVSVSPRALSFRPTPRNPTGRGTDRWPVCAMSTPRWQVGVWGMHPDLPPAGDRGQGRPEVGQVQRSRSGGPNMSDHADATAGADRSSSTTRRASRVSTRRTRFPGSVRTRTPSASCLTRTRGG